MGAELLDSDPLMTPAEVAAVLYVDPRTVTRWARAGKIHCFRTPGGHRRFLRSDIRALIAANSHGRVLEPSSGSALPPAPVAAAASAATAVCIANALTAALAPLGRTGTAADVVVVTPSLRPADEPVPGPARTGDAAGGNADQRPPVVLVLSAQHAEALATLLGRSKTCDPWLDRVRGRLSSPNG